MKPIIDNDTVQIEITNACQNRCANCTRFVGLAKPFMMDMKVFKRAVDTMVGFPNMTGIMGGEPLLHPLFEEFCDYALSKIPREQLGLWTCFPDGYERYREVICRTFGNILLNDHTKNDVYHHPFLVASADALKSKDDVYYWADRCYFQKAWSASINPKGAYFCEMAASFAMLYWNLPKGWEVVDGWWNRTPKDYTKQIEEFCRWCGGSLYLKRRASVSNDKYDTSPMNHNRLTNMGVSKDKLLVSDMKLCNFDEQEELASYKQQEYRDQIAARYGIFLSNNEKGFNEPYLMKDIYATGSILTKYTERYAVGQ